MVLLDATDLNADIENAHVLRDVSLRIDPGETVGLIGRNGAGKTTTIRCLVGLTPLTSGRIEFLDQDITDVPVRKRPGLGLAFMPEGRRLFTQLTVLDNLKLAAWGARGDDLSDEAIRTTVDTVTSTFPDVNGFLNRPAGQLSGGQQQMVAVGRALAANPEVVLLDEPFEGLAPSVREEFRIGIERIKELGVSVLLAESNVTHAEQAADRLYVLERGEILAELPTTDDLTADETIQRLFGDGHSEPTV